MRGPNSWQKCRGAGCTRWAQHPKTGLCRTCQRKLDPVYVSNRARDAEHVRRQQEKIAALPHATPDAAPRRTIVVAGVEYEVLWDGTR